MVEAADGLEAMGGLLALTAVAVDATCGVDGTTALALLLLLLIAEGGTVFAPPAAGAALVRVLGVPAPGASGVGVEMTAGAATTVDAVVAGMDGVTTGLEAGVGFIMPSFSSSIPSFFLPRRPLPPRRDRR